MTITNYNWGYDSIVYQDNRKIIFNKIIYSSHVVNLYYDNNEVWILEKGNLRIYHDSLEKFESKKTELILDKNKHYNLQNLDCSVLILCIVKILV